MTRVRLSNVLFAIATIVVFGSAPIPASAFLQSTVEYAWIFESNSLSGIVVDSARNPIKGVEIKETSEDGKDALQSTTSDDQGRFHFPPPTKNEIHYLQLRGMGLCPTLVRVRIKPKDKKSLTIQMQIAS